MLLYGYPTAVVLRLLHSGPGDYLQELVVCVSQHAAEALQAEEQSGTGAAGVDQGNSALALHETAMQQLAVLVLLTLEPEQCV